MRCQKELTGRGKDRYIADMGRPKKKIVMPFGWQEQIKALYEEGASVTEVLSFLKINRRQHSDLRAEDQEYDDITSQGEIDSQAWWEQMGRKNIGNNKFNTNLFSFVYRARFGIGKIDDANQEAVFSDKTKQAELLRKYDIKRAV
jgi:hypothetical protein